MAQAPLGIPTDEACVAAARAAGELLAELGHAVEEVEVPTISEEMVPPFIALTQGGLADYDGVDWSAVEPHIAHQRTLSGETRRLRLRARRRAARAAQPPRGRALGTRLRRARDAHLGDPASGGRIDPRAGSTPRPRRRCSTSSRASPSPPSATSPACPRSACRCTGPTSGLPVGVQLVGRPVAGGRPDRPRRAARAGAALGRAHRAARAGRLTGTVAGHDREAPGAPTRCSAAERRGAQAGAGV